MTGTNADTRVVRTLTTGSKVCLLLAIPFLVAAAYFYFAPIMVQLDTGPFSCQSRFNPPTDAYVLGRCANVHALYGARSGASLAVGLLIAAVGVGLFGFSTRSDKRADSVSPSS